MTLKDKILYCLEKYPESRNSDIKLTNAVWYEFHNSKVRVIDKKLYVMLEDLYQLPKEDNVKRWRAKIQNVEHHFLPTSEAVCKARKIEEFWWNREMSDISNPSLR
jgi:hypothetical protein